MAKVRKPRNRPVIVVHPSDNVATALAHLPAGSRVEVDVAGDAVTLVARDDIPRGHKVALCEITRGGAVTKYGETIGTASRKIAPGEHVHVHNVGSRRGRGDLARRGGGAGAKSGGGRKARAPRKRKGKA